MKARHKSRRHWRPSLPGAKAQESSGSRRENGSSNQRINPSASPVRNQGAAPNQPNVNAQAFGSNSQRAKARSPRRSRGTRWVPVRDSKNVLSPGPVSPDHKAQEELAGGQNSRPNSASNPTRGNRANQSQNLIQRSLAESEAKSKGDEDAHREIKRDSEDEEEEEEPAVPDIIVRSRMTALPVGCFHYALKGVGWGVVLGALSCTLSIIILMSILCAMFGWRLAKHKNFKCGTFVKYTLESKVKSYNVEQMLQLIDSKECNPVVQSKHLLAQGKKRGLHLLKGIFITLALCVIPGVIFPPSLLLVGAAHVCYVTYYVANFVANKVMGKVKKLFSLKTQGCRLVAQTFSHDGERRPPHQLGARCQTNVRYQLWELIRGDDVKLLLVNGDLLGECCSDLHGLNDDNAIRAGIALKTKNVCHYNVSAVTQAVLNPSTKIVAEELLLN